MYKKVTTSQRHLALVNISIERYIYISDPKGICIADVCVCLYFTNVKDIIVYIM